MIRFPCECGQQLQVPEEKAGKKVRCPKCSAVVTAPVPPTEESEVVETGVEVAPEDAPRRRREEVRADRPDEDEGIRISSRRRRREEEDEVGDRPRRPAAGSSGKAVASLILGLLSLLCLGGFLTGLPGLILGILALGDVSKKRVSSGKGLAITGIILSLMGSVVVPGLLYFGVQNVRRAAARMQVTNNYKQLGLAMHNHAAANLGRFPPAASTSPKGKSLLSWRVALLPYLEQQALYNQFHLDEPWDSPHNSKLLPLMPKVYGTPDRTPADGMTFAQVFVGPKTPFRNNRGPLLMQDFPDGTSNTILIAEASNPVPWTKPEDLAFDPNGPLPPLGGHFPWGFLVTMTDGSVRAVNTSTSPQTIKLAIMPDDGQPLGPDW